MTTTDIAREQRAFDWWVRHTSRRRTSDAASPAMRSRLGDGIEGCLLALRDDRTGLPPASRDLLGPLRPTTYDQAVRLLLWARHAPQGPRCRSYRAALRLVQRLDVDHLQGTRLQRAAG